MGGLIGVAVWTVVVFGFGYGLRAEQERQRLLRPKTLKQLMREQDVKPWQPGEQLPGEPMSDEEWTAWQDAMEEVRGR